MTKIPSLCWNFSVYGRRSERLGFPNGLFSFALSPLPPNERTYPELAGTICASLGFHRRFHSNQTPRPALPTAQRPLYAPQKSAKECVRLKLPWRPKDSLCGTVTICYINDLEQTRLLHVFLSEAAKRFRKAASRSLFFRSAGLCEED